MEQAKIRAIQYRYNNILERYEMLAIEGEKSMIGQIIDDVPEGYSERVIGFKYEKSLIHQWSAGLGRIHQVSVFGIDFNYIKLSEDYDDYQIFPCGENKERIIKSGKIDFLIGPKVSRF